MVEPLVVFELIEIEKSETLFKLVESQQGKVKQFLKLLGALLILSLKGKGSVRCI